MPRPDGLFFRHPWVVRAYGSLEETHKTSVAPTGTNWLLDVESRTAIDAHSGGLKMQISRFVDDVNTQARVSWDT